MPESAALSMSGGSPRVTLPKFLTLVLLVRLGHLVLLGTPLTGMNPKMAVLAKDWGQFGFGQTHLDVSPGPVCLLAAASGLAGLRPGQMIPPVLLLAHLCLAAGFWYWLRSLRPSAELAATSLLLFAFLPGHNSYIGLDNFPVLFAASAFLAATAIWHLSLDGPLANQSWLGLVLGGAAIAMFRGDYLFYLPLYLFTFLLLYRVWQQCWPRRGAWVAAGVLCAGLGAGLLGVMVFRHYESGHFALVARDYTCWAFLDGTPPAWQSPADHSEADRVRSGIRHFGHPAEYGYSASRMMLQHPLKTVTKFVLNLPSWLFELGRRHVVVPLPLALLAAWGAALMVRRRGPPGIQTCWPALFAAILMTLPLAALIVSARYVMPAFGAVCVLAAAGLLAVLAWCHRLLRGKVPLRAVWWGGMVTTCVALELLLLRGGGLLRDAPNLRPVARYLDEHFAGPPRVPLVLDPHRDAIDGDCRADICNRRIYRTQGLSQYGFDLRDPWAAARSPEAATLAVRTVVFWAAGTGDAPDDRRRLAQWQQAGYVLHRVDATRENASPRYTIFVLHSDGSQPGEVARAVPVHAESEHERARD